MRNDKSMIKLSPSILSADFLRLGEEIRAAEEAGADMLHIDIMDGMFVPNITIGPAVVGAIKKASRLLLDVHLMIESPERYIDDFAGAGADYLSVHVEASVHLHRTVSRIKEKGVKAGVSLNPSTPLTSIEEILPYLDMALVMSVNPGFGGQKFIPEAIDKVKRLKRLIKDKRLKAVIEVDGGVTPANAKDVARAGADILVMGSAFFGCGGPDDYKTLVKDMRKKLG